MTTTPERLAAALADRYTIERELGAGGMATELAAESRGSADVAKATFHLNQCPSSKEILGPARGERHFSDISRAVALATSTQ